jgi:hypothetical protein
MIRDPRARAGRTFLAVLVGALLAATWLIPATATAEEAPARSGPKPAIAKKVGSTAAKPPAVDRAASPAPAAKPERHGKGIRTLDEITIEGEIAVPQVLFITARDRQRYRDFLHRQYLKTSLELAQDTVFPEAICLGPRP